MIINIKTIPHDQHRYPTVGDWWWTPEGNLEIRVSKMSDWRYEVLVGFHELCEVLICKYLGITQESVDSFDTKFEVDRAAGLHEQDEEPGDSKDAPYRIPHFIATNCERILALALGVDWKDYDEEVTGLP